MREEIDDERPEPRKPVDMVAFQAAASDALHKVTGEHGATLAEAITVLLRVLLNLVKLSKRE